MAVPCRENDRGAARSGRQGAQHDELHLWRITGGKQFGKVVVFSDPGCRKKSSGIDADRDFSARVCRLRECMFGEIHDSRVVRLVSFEQGRGERPRSAVVVWVRQSPLKELGKDRRVLWRRVDKSANDLGGKSGVETDAF